MSHLSELPAQVSTSPPHDDFISIFFHTLQVFNEIKHSYFHRNKLNESDIPIKQRASSQKIRHAGQSTCKAFLECKDIDLFYHLHIYFIFLAISWINVL